MSDESPQYLWTLTSTGKGVVGAAGICFLLGLFYTQWLGVGVSILVAFGLSFYFGQRNLKNIHVKRLLLGPMFAQRRQAGTVQVCGQGRRLTIVDSSAESQFRSCDGPCILTYDWQFNSRGFHTLPDIEVSSDWPFGWLIWKLNIPSTTKILVWAQPVKCDVTGDFELNLREYRVGDRPSYLHFQSSARMGRWMVHAPHPIENWIDFHSKTMTETEIGMATFQVLYAKQYRQSIGWRWKNEVIQPKADIDTWHRILDRLAILEAQ